MHQSVSRWWFQIFSYFHPYLGISNLTNIFSDGLKPPTRIRRMLCHDGVAVAQVQDEFESILLDPACVAWLSVRGTQIRTFTKSHKKPMGRACLMRVDEMLWDCFWRWLVVFGCFGVCFGCIACFFFCRFSVPEDWQVVFFLGGETQFIT